MFEMLFDGEGEPNANESQFSKYNKIDKNSFNYLYNHEVRAPYYSELSTEGSDSNKVAIIPDHLKLHFEAHLVVSYDREMDCLKHIHNFRCCYGLIAESSVKQIESLAFHTTTNF